MLLVVRGRPRGDGMSALAPGLYRATVRGVPDVDVMVSENGTGVSEYVTLRGGARHRLHIAEHITNARPLTVLDISTWFPHRAAHALDVLKATSPMKDAGAAAFLIDILEQITAQEKPARIEEPGQWGVVEAGWPDTLGPTCHWVRDEYGWTTHGGTTLPWGRLVDPTLIRDGIEATS